MARNFLCSAMVFISGMCSLNQTFAVTGSDYMDRFNRYLAWYQQIPITPSPEFLEMVKEQAPLSNKLREKWLYELARLKDWNRYNTYYQESKDTNLICFKRLAEFNTAPSADVSKKAIPLWLTAYSQAGPCNTLFDLLLKSDDFDQNLITQRLALALNKQNVPLAIYLLKHYKKPDAQHVQTLMSIHQNPNNITKIPEIAAHGDTRQLNLNHYFYLYGLKRMVSTNMEGALKIWENPKTKKILPHEQQQEFLAHVALYKAMRNHSDSLEWFAKVTPAFYSDVLLDWQIRFALKNNDWHKTAQLIQASKNKDTPCWQYWLARSLEEQGQQEQARAIYNPLSMSRNYYGFLASMRLKKSLSFEHEKPVASTNILKPYASFISQIKTLYQTKQTLQASRLLNDFISELPKNEASALVYWVDSELQWHGKSVYLSSNETLNNQLELRFPLAYDTMVKTYSKQYSIPPELVYAIIRQESGFREDAISTAGAKGLMQIMPYTAQVVSKAFKIPYADPKQLFASQKNINIGIAYLQQLAKRFRYHPVLVAAAYNAGPKQVVYWLNTHPPKAIDLWIETLPWQETRNYLKNILAFYVVYQYRLKQTPNLKEFLVPL